MTSLIFVISFNWNSFKSKSSFETFSAICCGVNPVWSITFPRKVAAPFPRLFPLFIFSTTLLGNGTPNSSTPSIPNNLHTVLSIVVVVC